jgi:transcriptional regulator with XRE-family HTH domain
LTFTDWLIGLRGTRSRAEVARAAAIDRSSLSRAEKGERIFSLTNLKKLCVVYDIPIDEGVQMVNQARQERDMRRARE